MAARSASVPEARDALAALCELYWSPLYSYARRCGCSVDEAQDLTQGFFAFFIERGDVSAADPRRGRFRSFLLTAFKHFMSNERDRQHALKRGGGHQLLSFDVDAIESRYAADVTKDISPESVFERNWARGVIDRSLAMLRAECEEAGKATLFAHLQTFLVGEKSAGGYAGVAESLGTSEGAIKVTVHRLRRRMRELLKSEIALTVSEDSEIDEELRYLMHVLGS
jgi:RNA polymerase sigma factor (sigma-70 family)